MSTSRLEKFIYAICSMEVSDLPAPLSRIEILWNCLITGETPDFEPQSRNEQYLMAMLGLYELENLPTPMSRGEKLLYKIAMGETDLSDIPAYLSRYEELLGYLAENGGVGDFEYILQTLNQRLSTLYSTKEKPMKQAVIKGDTLVNELPRPSLKNTMINAASQKLNQGYNEKTLVNLVKNSDIVFKKTPGDQFGGTYTSNIRCMIASVNNINPNTKYLIKMLSDTKQVFIRFFNNSSNASTGNTSWINSNTIFTTGSDTSKINLSFRLSENNEEYTDISQCSNILLFEYQDGMENWDIPYFEGTKTFSATPNVVDGEFKSAILKGQTLVNLLIPVKTQSVNNYVQKFQYGLKELTIIITNKTVDKYPRLSIYDSNTKNWLRNIDPTFTGNKLHYVAKDGEYVNGIVFTTYGSNINIYDYSSLDEYLLQQIMVLEGDYTNVDIPYFEGMASVKMPVLTTTGKNLLNPNYLKEQCLKISSSATYTDGNIVFHSGAFHKKRLIALDFEPNTQYAFNFKMSGKQGSQLHIKVYYTNNTDSSHIPYISDTTGIISGVTNANATVEYITISFGNGTSGCVLYVDECSLFKSNTVMPHEPFKSNILTTPEEVVLRKVGDVEDEFDALTGQVIERVGEVTFDGSDDELWSVDTARPNHYKFLIPLTNSYYEDRVIITSSVISDKYPSINNGSPDTGGSDAESICINGWVVDGRGKFNLSISKTKLSDGSVETLKTYLQQNPFTVQYRLETKSTKTVNTTITDQDGTTQTKLHSFNDGHLSVSSQGLLPSVVNYEVPTNNSYYLPDMLTLGAQYTARGSADCNATIDGKLLALGKNRTFTTPSSVTNRLMVLDAPVDDLMFIKGDQTAKDFGYFEGMKSVVLSNKMPVLTTVGKNLLDEKTITSGYITSNGRFRSDKANALFDYIKVCPSITYYGYNFGYVKAIQISWYDYNKIFLERVSCLNNNPVVAPTNACYARVHGQFFGSNTIENNLLDVQIMFSTQPIAKYEPYKTNILSASEDVELRGIGDAQDTLGCLTGEVTERIGEIVLDGSESWNKFSIDSMINHSQFYFRIEGKLHNSQVLCDSFVSKSRQSSDNGGECVSGDGGNGKNIWINILNSRLTSSDVDGFKQWLSQNPITVQYQLVAPSIKTVDLTTVDQDGQPTKLKTFNDITYVEINSDPIVPSVNMEVATKISETLATLDPQQNDISNTQNKLSQTIDEQSENTDATMMATTEIYEQTL